ncbi:hypothetical protein ACFSL4_07815 [Streptomyces caeni]|uniref:Uncharacterized protein n=1 Tax=Streptomyces caeni TaxID=2307231 RepID=A0ABW4ILF9_9ACTN
MPETGVIGAAAEYERAADQARRADRGKRPVRKVHGHAIGEGPEAHTGMDDLGVIPAAEERVWCERIAARLGERWPDVYGEWGGAQVTSALKPWGVETGHVWGTDSDGEGRNRRGITRADVVAAITRRDAGRAAPALRTAAGPRACIGS